MSTMNSRHGFSRRTVAVALAAGTMLGGTQVVDMPNNSFGFGAATAEAAILDQSVVTNVDLVSDKSGKSIVGTTVEATKKAYNDFKSTHGDTFKLKIDIKLPDDAKPGDVLKFGSSSLGFAVSDIIQASTEDGRKVGFIDIPRGG